jgi:RNA polymerase sigma-70 factor (ECF subfamily)
MSDTDSRLHTRPSLLLRVRDARDHEAWRVFTETYAPLVYRYCRQRGLQDADAADVTQEVLAQVARSIRAFQYQPERGRFRDWLGTVTRRKMARFVDKSNAPGRGTGGDGDDALNELVATDDPDWTAEFSAHLLAVAMQRVCPEFEPATWRAFQLLWVENRSGVELARELAQTVDSLYVAKSRVLKRLREEVQALAEDMTIFEPLS